MEVKQSYQGYPIFCMDKVVEYWKPDIWIDMIGKIAPDYFERGRFSFSKKVERINVIDCASYNHEGDGWEFSLVDLEFVDKTASTVFLPLLRTVLPEEKTNDDYMPRIQKALCDNPERITFGIQTESEFFGKRDWVVYDAFYDNEISVILIKMFWPDEEYYSLTIQKGNFGEIVFHTTLNSMIDFGEKFEMITDRFGNITIGNNKSMLNIPNDLRILDMDQIRKKRDIQGWIEYKSDLRGSIGIGVLEKVRMISES